MRHAGIENCNHREFSSIAIKNRDLRSYHPHSTHSAITREKPMERTQRMIRINALVSRPQGATMAQMMEDMEVSRATINRDIELMRKQMNAPIDWDSFREIYYLNRNSSIGPTYMLPGQWFTPAQAYAFLTLNNMVEKIAPNVLGPYLEPMRGLLKEMLYKARFDLYGLDRKIAIDMPDMPAVGDLDFQNLTEALIREQSVRIVVRAPSGLEHTVAGTPVRLHIAAAGWRIEIKQNGEVEPVTIDIAHIRKVIAPDEEAT